MIYKISHLTNYTYTSPVSICHNLLMLTPRVDGRLQLMQHRVNIKPLPDAILQRTDVFGNKIITFTLEENHRQLSMSANSSIKLKSPTVNMQTQTPQWTELVRNIKEYADPNWLAVSRFTYPSPRIKREKLFKTYAESCFPAGQQILPGAALLAEHIFKDFKYDSTATNVYTPAEEAFKLKRGVCQDFAHIMISCLRMLNIPARYVSGYLSTQPPPGKPKLVGIDQSHAWVEVYCGADVGWVELDPTNNCLAGLSHIPIAWGRDYADVVPIKGVFLGGGDNTLSVKVDVVPEAE